jgi:hypothetical protein
MDRRIATASVRSECPFEKSFGNCATDTGPTESPADVEAPHTKRIRDNGVDNDAAHSSQHEQGFIGSIEKHRARRPILRESTRNA